MMFLKHANITSTYIPRSVYKIPPQLQTGESFKQTLPGQVANSLNRKGLTPIEQSEILFLTENPDVM